MPNESAAPKGVESTYRLLDLFSGIGGFSLGLERSGGFRTVAFCEIDPYCRRVLAKHWPEVPQYDDIRTLTAERLAADGIGVDAICGGFPCQDISIAGKGAGLAGERSGLWSEYLRLIRTLGPRYVVVENVGALLVRGLDVVLGQLAEIGYDAEWHCIPASAIGGPHHRDRVWIVASPNGIRRETMSVKDLVAGQEAGERDWWSESIQFCRTLRGGTRPIPTSRICGMDHGLSKELDRLRALGNAVVPQIPELIGRAILAAEGRA